jgi:hypothetical protein
MVFVFPTTRFLDPVVAMIGIIVDETANVVSIFREVYKILFGRTKMRKQRSQTLKCEFNKAGDYRLSLEKNANQ